MRIRLLAFASASDAIGAGELDLRAWLDPRYPGLAPLWTRLAVAQVVPEHLQEVREAKLKLIAKTEAAVKDRLTREITHRVHYLRRPFQREPDFGVVSQNYDFAKLLELAEPPR